MPQKSHLGNQAREKDLARTNWLANTLAFLFGLTLIAIVLLVLLGALVWHNWQISAIGSSLLSVVGGYFKLVWSEALRSLRQRESAESAEGEGKAER